MTKIFLVRHAEAEGNIYRRAHGHYNGLVTERGYQQIERLGKRLAEIQIDAVYSSDLFRAKTTAAAVSEPRGLEIHTSEKLREVKMGVWEDTPWGDIEYFTKDEYYNFCNDPALWSVTGSESFENVQNRMLDFITEIAKRHDGGTIAVFTHGFALRVFMCLLEGIASHKINEMPYCDNTAVSVINYDNGEFKVEYLSDNSHLTEEVSTLANQTWWRTEKKWASENLRFMPLNKVASENLLRIFRAKAGERAHVDKQYAAFIMDEPVGILGLDTERDHSRGLGWISYLHVVPGHREKTFGTQLLGVAVSDFRKLKREKLRIEVPSGSLGINFLSRWGFTALDVSYSTCLMEKDIRNW